MAELSPGQSAKQMLERQLEGLGSLYNAGVRSQGFREWRQATLTCIQRIWPAEPARPERFRRIPFSPPMGRPDERAVREYYERGCGEAASLLKGWVAEIATVGLSGPGATAPVASSPSASSRSDDDFPTVDLPGTSSGASAGGPVPAKPRLKDMLGFAEGPPAAPLAPGTVEAPPAGAASQGAPPLPRPPAPAPAAAAQGAPPLPQSAVPTHAPASPPAAATPPSPAAQAMAELESRGFFAPPGHLLRGTSAATPAGTAPAPSAAPQPRIVVTGNEPPASATPPRTTPAAEAAAARAVDPDDLEHVAEELLRASSALSSLPRRPVPERKPGTREVRSPIPLAIAALALEVDALGVPEGHRSRIRAMLLDLSRRLDAPNLSWDALRDAMAFVMEFPTLGRRMVPLLLPYFDRAA